jgi:hypothetical protein
MCVIYVWMCASQAIVRLDRFYSYWLLKTLSVTELILVNNYILVIKIGTL